MSVLPISVIIPCYCCSGVLPRAVNSILRQSVLPAEIILVDDASTDHGLTKRCIKEMVSSRLFTEGVVIRAHFLPYNLGPAGARNAAWDIASKPYIAFLDADDSWAPDKLEIQYHWMERNSDFTLSCHGSTHIADAVTSIGCEPIKYAEIHSLSLMLKNSISTRTVMVVNRPEFRFPTAMRYSEDYYLWLNMVMQGARLAKIQLPLAFSYKRDYGEGGLSCNLRAMHAGVLDCYRHLRRQRLIGLVTFWLIFILEKIKYFRRLTTNVVYARRALKTGNEVRDR